MQPRMSRQEVSRASEALTDWFISQGIGVPNAAIVMIHLLGVMTGDCARDADDLAIGVGHINNSINHNAARAFCAKHGIDPNTL